MQAWPGPIDPAFEIPCQRHDLSPSAAPGPGRAFPTPRTSVRFPIAARTCVRCQPFGRTAVRRFFQRTAVRRGRRYRERVTRGAVPPALSGRASASKAARHRRVPERTDVCPGPWRWVSWTVTNGCSLPGGPGGPGLQPGDGTKETPMAEVLSGKRRQILTYIADSQRERGYPPSVREIGRRSGWPRRPRSTPTWPSSSGRGTSPVTRPSPGPSRCTSIQTPRPADRGGRAQHSAGGRRGGRDRGTRRGEHRGAPAHARAVHRHGPLLHAAGPRRLHDRGGHLRRGLRSGAPTAGRRQRRRRGGRHR